MEFFCNPLAGSRESWARLTQQFLQILLPDRGPGVRAVPVSLLGNRNQHEAAILYMFSFALRDA